MLRTIRTVAKPSVFANRAAQAGARRKGNLRRNLVRAFLLTLLVVIVALGAAVAVVVSGPTELGLLRSRVEQTLRGGLGPGYDVKVGKTVLDVDRVLGLVVLVDDIAVTDAESEEVVAIPATRLAIDPMAVFAGRGLIRSVEITGARFSITRAIDGTVELGRSAAAPPKANGPIAADAEGDKPAGPAEPEGGFPDLFAALQILDRGIEPPVTAALRAGFEHFTMTQADIDVWDANHSQSRHFPRTDLTVAVDIASNDVAVNFTTSGYGGRWSASAERSVDPVSGERNLSATFSQLSLADLFPDLGQENSPVSSDIPFYGRATARLGEDGAVKEAKVRLDLGAGNIRFRDDRENILLDEATVKLSWDVANNVVVIEPSSFFLGPSRGVLTGTVRPVGDPNLRQYAFSLESRGAVLAPRDSPEAPLVVQRMAVSGTADLPGALLKVEDAVVQTSAGSVSAAGSIGFEGATPSLVLAASLSDMPAATVKQIWPPFVAGPARAWVLKHVQEGRLSSGRIDAAIPSGLLWTGKRLPLPDDALRLDFRLSDMTFTTIGDVPAVTHASGNAALAGSTFGLDIEQGEVKLPSGRTVTINNGAFAITNTVQRTPDGRVELDIAGDAAALAEIANVKPFQALSRQNIDPAGFSGVAHANISAKWPLRPEVTETDIDWRVKVSVDGFSSLTPMQGHTIREGKIALTATPEDVTIQGKARIDGVAADLNMVQPLQGGVVGAGGQRQVRLVLDDEARKRLGLGMEDVIAGTIGVTVNDGGKGGQRFDLDLSRARLVLAGLGWSKGIGVAARLTFDLVPAGDGFKVANIVLKGAGFGLSGSALLDGKYGLVSADIDNLSLRRGDSVSLSLKRSKSGYAISARGSSFDARGLIAEFRKPGDRGANPPDIVVDAAIDHLIGFNQETIDRANLALNSSNGAVSRFKLTGSLSGRDIGASYTEANRAATLDVQAADAGRFFRFIDLYSRMGGGALRLTGRRTSPGSPLVGSFDITDFNIQNEPAMARVLSPDAPGAQGINPSSVSFDRMVLNYTFRNQQIVIDEAVLRGAAMGATFDGRIDLATASLALQGTYLPAYALNNLFGKIPIIGMFAGAGPNGGLVGITFKLEGSFDAPRVTINALSAIAPGIFRKIFEFH